MYLDFEELKHNIKEIERIKKNIFSDLQIKIMKLAQEYRDIHNPNSSIRLIDYTVLFINFDIHNDSYTKVWLTIQSNITSCVYEMTVFIKTDNLYTKRRDYNLMSVHLKREK